MRPEVKPYQPQIDILVQFAEGKIEGPALDVALNTAPMQALLEVFVEPRYPASTNYWGKLQCQDRVTLRGLVNSEGIINLFLGLAQVEFQPANRYTKILSLLLRAVPDYIDPPLEYLTEHIVPKDAALSDAQKKKQIKERLNQEFRCMGKPPKWIQSADWPISGSTPLVFVGQIAIDAPDFFHDRGAAYLFFNPADGSNETVLQFY